MNTLIAFCVLLVCGQQASASKKSDANPLLFFSQQSANDCKSAGLQCKDCQTIQYCSSNLESIFEVQCEAQSRLRPFCDVETNTCVTDKPAVCNLPEHSFHCPGSGYYPDLEDCSSLYLCDENRVATKMECPAGYNWDQATESCKVYYCRSYSPKLGQCKGKTNKLVAYAGNKNLYVLCLTNGPILFQCPNKWEVFDEAEVTCKFECTQNGYFPNPSDPRKFYSCTKVGKGYESVSLECPEGYEFAQLGDGQGICTFAPTTTTTTTEAPTTIEIEDIVSTVVDEEEHQTEENGNNEEQPENNEETGHDEQPENNEETENSEQPENNEETENVEQPENNEETEHAEQPENNEDTENAEQPENNEETEHVEQPENDEEAEKAEQPENSENNNEENNNEEPANNENELAVEPNNSESNNEEHHSEETVNELEPESSVSGDHSLTEEIQEELTNLIGESD